MHSPQSELRATQVLFRGAMGRRTPHSLNAGSPGSSAATVDARPKAAANKAAAAEAWRAKKIVQVLKECLVQHCYESHTIEGYSILFPLRDGLVQSKLVESDLGEVKIVIVCRMSILRRLDTSYQIQLLMRNIVQVKVSSPGIQSKLTG